MQPSRRDFLVALAAFAADPAAAEGARLAPTPACTDDDDPTAAQTEGPYFTPATPLKRDFAANRPLGRRITLAGHVLDTGCRPQPGALIELWHADETGAYDNDGFSLRGHQVADEGGVWRFDTIVPGRYPGRTLHYHLKVLRPGGRLLTTQLYFPDDPANARDGLFDPALALRMARIEDAALGRFDFIVA